MFAGINRFERGSEALEGMRSFDLTPDFAYRGVHDHDGITRNQWS